MFAAAAANNANENVSSSWKKLSRDILAMVEVCTRWVLSGLHFIRAVVNSNFNLLTILLNFTSKSLCYILIQTFLPTNHVHIILAPTKCRRWPWAWLQKVVYERFGSGLGSIRSSLRTHPLHNRASAFADISVGYSTWLRLIYRGEQNCGDRLAVTQPETA